MFKTSVWIQMYNNAVHNWNELNKTLRECTEPTNISSLESTKEMVQADILTFLKETLVTADDYKQVGLPYGVLPVVIDKMTNKIVGFLEFSDHPGTTLGEMMQAVKVVRCSKCDEPTLLDAVTPQGCPNCISKKTPSVQML